MNEDIAASMTPYSEGAKGDVGNLQEHTAGEIAGRVLELCGGSAKIIHEPLSKNDQKCHCEDKRCAR